MQAVNDKTWHRTEFQLVYYCESLNNDNSDGFHLLHSARTSNPSESMENGDCEGVIQEGERGKIKYTVM